MRILIAMMKHETNTFSPVPTPLERFGRGGAKGGPLYGREAFDSFKGTGTAMGAYIDIAEKAGAEIVTPIAASSPPSAPVQDAAFDHITQTICDAAAKGCDAIMLDLHGAMVTEAHEDGEGEFLERLRAVVGPDLPIATALDMHTNMYDQIVRHSTILAGYQTYPHIDNYETGMRAGSALMRVIREGVKPTTVWGNRPMLPHVMRQGTDDFPNREIQERTKQMEKEGALCASFFVGFPHADIYNAGVSAVVVTDNDPELAARYRDELLDMAWRDREAMVYKIEPLAESLARAQQIAAGPGEGPVILLDHFDNTASGGTMDTTTVLGAILEAGLGNVAAFAIHDPGSVDQMIRAGVGAQVTLRLGGKTDMPSIGLKGQPIEVTGRVKTISDGNYRNRGPASKGVMQSMGRTAVLDTGRVEIVVIEHYVEPNDLNSLYSIGIDPLAKSYIMLKSRIHYRAGFKPIAKQIVECAGTGVCTSDYNQLTFRNVRRPIYPLDLVNDPAMSIR